MIVLGPALFAAHVSAAALPIAAFAGALAVAAFVYRLAASRGRLALPLLLLAGIAINALVGAAIGLLTFVADDAQLRSLTLEPRQPRRRAMVRAGGRRAVRRDRLHAARA